MKKLLFIYNSKAGKGKIRNNLQDIIEIFTRAGYEVTARPTLKGTDAKELAENKSKDFDLVVCSGGDGTMDGVITGMLNAPVKKPIGYIPAGSTNDFAVSLKIPKEMKKAAQNAVRGKSFLCDMGRFNDDYFMYIAAFGLFTDVSYETPQEIKNVLGHTAYILGGVKSLLSIPTFSIRVKADGREIEGEYMYGMITNSVSVGGFKNVTGPSVKLNDGLFEVTLIKKPKSPMDLQKIISALLGKEMENDYICCFKASHIEVESKKEIAWTLDGEFGGNHKCVEIDNLPQALEIIVP